jgi:hypothetical protein
MHFLAPTYVNMMMMTLHYFRLHITFFLFCFVFVFKLLCADIYVLDAIYRVKPLLFSDGGVWWLVLYKDQSGAKFSFFIF